MAMKLPSTAAAHAVNAFPSLASQAVRAAAITFEMATKQASIVVAHAHRAHCQVARTASKMAAKQASIAAETALRAHRVRTT